MNKIKLYSPPIITAKGKIKIGHGANLVWCDILGRTFKQEGQEIDYFFPAWNHQGKMFEQITDLDEREQRILDLESELGDKLKLFNLSEYRTYRDSNKESQKNAQDKFLKLIKKGYIASRDNILFLDAGKIIQTTDVISYLNNANFYPTFAKSRMLDLTKTIDSLYPITKPRTFATTIPREENSCYRINPIFDLAVSPLLFSEEPIDYAIDGLKTAFHGTFIPFLIWAGLSNIPFAKNVNIHGFVLPQEGEFSNLPIEELVKKTNTDVARYITIPCTNCLENTFLEDGRVKKGIKTLSKIVKLAWHLRNLSPKENYNEKDNSVLNKIHTMNHLDAIEYVSNKVLDINRKLEMRTLSMEDIKNYKILLNTLEPIFPETYNKAIAIWNKN